MMNPGKLNKKIEIYKAKTGQDEYGEQIDEKETVLSCYASIKNKSGSEQFKTNTPFEKVITSFLIRFPKTKIIDATMKISFNGDIYNITYVDNYNFSNQCLEITAEKVV